VKNSKLFVILAISGLLLVLAALPSLSFAQTAPTPTLIAAPATGVPNVVISPWIVPLDGDSQVIIAGSDFEPGQKISIMIRDISYGTLNDISSSVDPEPVANEQGAWASVWTLDRFASRGIFTEGLYRIRITDENGVTSASAPLGLVDVTKPREEWPAWALVAIPEVAD
jgi:hypothetical protein